MAENMMELRRDLYSEFTEAISDARSMRDKARGMGSPEGQLRQVARTLQAAAKTAEAIVRVEHEMNRRAPKP
jgi:hypothetical protein